MERTLNVRGEARDFFIINPRQDFASYWPEKVDGMISDDRIIDAYKQKEVVIKEYLGDPPRKAGKKADFITSAESYFLNPKALDLFKLATNGKLLINSIKIIDRESEEFFQIMLGL